MLANLRATVDVRYGSQQAGARELGVHPIRLNRNVNGWTESTPVERQRFAEMMGVDANWLFRKFTIPVLVDETPSESGTQQLSEIASELTSIVERIGERIDS